MKNLPEQDFWNSIRNRLLQYKEEPDDDWDKIAGAIMSTKSDYTGFSKATDIAVVVLFAFLLGFVTRDFAIPTRFDNNLAGKVTLPEAEQRVVSNKDKAEKGFIGNEKVVDGQSASDEITDGKRTGSTMKSVRLGVEPEKLSSVDDEVQKNVHVFNEQNLKNDSKTSTDLKENLKLLTSAQPDSIEEIVKSDSVVEVKNVASPAPKENKKTKKKFRPSIYVVASPTLGFYKVVPMKDDQVNVTNLVRKGIFSGDRLGVQLEAGFQMAIARNLELYASGTYYQTEQTISYSFTDPSQMSVAATDWKLSYTLSPGESTAAVNFKQKNIGGGLGLMYHIRGRKLMHKVGGGLQFAQGLVRQSDAEGNYLPSSRSLNYNLFYRMEYSVGPRTSIFLQPSFTRTLSTEKLNAPFEVKPYHAGLGIGWLYHF